MRHHLRLCNRLCACSLTRRNRCSLVVQLINARTGRRTGPSAEHLAGEGQSRSLSSSLRANVAHHCRKRPGQKRAGVRLQARVKRFVYRYCYPSKGLFCDGKRATSAVAHAICDRLSRARRRRPPDLATRRLHHTPLAHTPPASQSCFTRSAQWPTTPRSPPLRAHRPSLELRPFATGGCLRAWDLASSRTLDPSVRGCPVVSMPAVAPCLTSLSSRQPETTWHLKERISLGCERLSPSRPSASVRTVFTPFRLPSDSKCLASHNSAITQLFSLTSPLTADPIPSPVLPPSATSTDISAQLVAIEQVYAEILVTLANARSNRPLARALGGLFIRSVSEDASSGREGVMPGQADVRLCGACGAPASASSSCY